MPYPSNYLTSFVVSMMMLTSSFSCKTAPFVPGDQKENYIRFGNGGGFTGAVNAYYLTENGMVYRDEGSTVTKLFEADPTFAKQMFAMPQILNIKEKPYNDPGNRYFFIEVFTDTDKQKLVWGGDKIQIKAYETWYQNLMFMVKKANINPPPPVE